MPRTCAARERFPLVEVSMTRLPAPPGLLALALLTCTAAAQAPASKGALDLRGQTEALVRQALLLDAPLAEAIKALEGGNAGQLAGAAVRFERTFALLADRLGD